MVYDKKNGNIAFIEKDHKYIDVTDTTKDYISVTTLIHRYVEEYDVLYWSAYKSLEKLLPKEAWAIEKKSLLASKKFDKSILDVYGIAESVFNEVQQAILDEWDENKRKSSERGTLKHAELENSFYVQEKDISMVKFGVGGKFECKRDYTELDLDYGVYPEYLISYESPNKKLRLAGQIDLLIKNKNDIVLADHKFTHKIDKVGYYNNIRHSTNMMKYPLNNLPDTNFWHYSLQLSTYAWMLQNINPNFKIKDLIINHYDDKGENTLYHVDYLKNEVVKMLGYYVKEHELEMKRNNRKRIEY
ncbi:MAG: PD-(D/E)XK nuclease family protein [Prevotella sp.]|nr:PD-(D/E)XK nuclease family protein [Prevotella sp.]